MSALYKGDEYGDLCLRIYYSTTRMANFVQTVNKEKIKDKYFVNDKLFLKKCAERCIIINRQKGVSY